MRRHEGKPHVGGVSNRLLFAQIHTFDPVAVVPMSFSIHSIYSLVFKIWREKRFRIFIDTIKPKSHERILDVGGVPHSWTSRPQPVSMIKCVNIYDLDWDAQEYPQHQIQAEIGDGCQLEEADGSFPIVFSNSVIEHVGDFENQQKFAREVRRVGERLWIQTPAYECPLEPHFLLPFVHWLPVPARRFVVRWFSPWSWLEKPSKEGVKTTIQYTQLLTKGQFRSLFPDCQILTEKMLGFIPKSYIAVRTTVASVKPEPNQPASEQIASLETASLEAGR